MIDTRPDIPEGYTCNKQGRELTFKHSSGFWREQTYNENGRLLTYNNSHNKWEEYFYDIRVFVTADMKVRKL